MAAGTPTITVPQACWDPLNDRRENLETITGLEGASLSKLKEQARSVALLVHERALEIIPETERWRFKPGKAPSLDQYFRTYKNKGGPRAPYEEKEKFREEPRISVGGGTGFLVSDRHLATAAHVVCVDNSANLDLDFIENLRVVFDFHMTSETECQMEFDTIYKIQKVIAWDYFPGSGIDYAILRLKDLDKDEKGFKVVGREPLPIQQEIRDLDGLYALGHPSLLPLKYTHSGKIQQKKDLYFTSDLDTFPGNSGCPIADAKSQAVVAIHNAGYHINYEYNATTHRWKPHHPGPGKTPNTQHMKISYIFDLIKAIREKQKCQKVILKKTLSCSYDKNNLVEPYRLAPILVPVLTTVGKSYDCTRDCSRSYSESCVIS